MGFVLFLPGQLVGGLAEPFNGFQVLPQLVVGDDLPVNFSLVSADSALLHLAGRWPFSSRSYALRHFASHAPFSFRGRTVSMI